MSSFIERLARSGTRRKEQPVPDGEGLKAMATRMRQKAATLPRIIDQKTAREIWDKTWEDYLKLRESMSRVEQSAREALPHNIRHQKFR